MTRIIESHNKKKEKYIRLLKTILLSLIRIGLNIVLSDFQDSLFDKK